MAFWDKWAEELEQEWDELMHNPFEWSFDLIHDTGDIVVQAADDTIDKLEDIIHNPEDNLDYFILGPAGAASLEALGGDGNEIMEFGEDLGTAITGGAGFVTQTIGDVLTGGGGGGGAPADSSNLKTGYLQQDIVRLEVGSNLLSDIRFLTEPPQQTEAEARLISPMKDSEVQALYARVMSRAQIAKIGQRMARPGELNPLGRLSDQSRALTRVPAQEGTNKSVIKTPTAEEVDSGTGAAQVPTTDLTGAPTTRDGVAPTQVGPTATPTQMASPTSTENQRLQIETALGELKILKEQTRKQIEDIQMSIGRDNLNLTQRRKSMEREVGERLERKQITFEQYQSEIKNIRATNVTNEQIDDFVRNPQGFAASVAREAGVERAKQLTGMIQSHLAYRNLLIGSVQMDYQSRVDEILKSAGISKEKLGTKTTLMGA